MSAESTHINSFQLASAALAHVATTLEDPLPALATFARLADEDSPDECVAAARAAYCSAGDFEPILLRLTLTRAEARGGDLGAVSIVGARDAEQPRAGTIGERGARGAAQDASLLSRAPSAPPLRRIPSAPAPLDEPRALRGLLAWIHVHCPLARAPLTDALVALLGRIGSDPSPDAAAAIAVAVDVIAAQCAGHAAVCGSAMVQRLSQCSNTLCIQCPRSSTALLALLAPLLRLSGRAGDAACALDLCHAPIAALMSSCALANDAALAPRVGSIVGAALDEALAESPPRALLLLHQLSALVADVASVSSEASSAAAASATAHMGHLLTLVRPILSSLVSHDHSRLAQGALSFFRCTHFVAAVAGDDATLGACVSALLRGGACTPHWNATVNRQTHAALSALAERGGARFSEAVARVFSQTQNICALPLPACVISGGGGGAGAMSSPPAPQLRLPPDGTTAAGPGLPVHTVPQRPARKTIESASAWRPGCGRPPPATITGVAPWAIGGSLHMPALGLRAPTAVTPPMLSSLATVSTSENNMTPPSTTASSRLNAFLALLVPPRALPSLNHPNRRPALLRFEATLAPHLRFHDLVFGRELGTGGFGSVRHARAIMKGADAPPQAQWPEFAVKTLSRETLASMSYATAAAREVGILASMSHPGCARLVTAFTWRGSVLLVQEFARGGDLHLRIATCGPLQEAQACFLLAEVATALDAIHRAGFAFGDVKPENIVLVTPPPDEEGGSSGAWEGVGSHAKLCDFGASRPFSDAGRSALARQSRILATLRDGDWRAAVQAEVGEAAGAGSNSAEASDERERLSSVQAAADPAFDDDARVEGTQEYLAPELRGGGVLPSVASDAYAFGVTIYQTLTGKLPRPGAVWGHVGAECGDDGRGVRFSAPPITSSFPQTFPPLAADLVRALLHPDPLQRLGGGAGGFADVLAHPWWAALGDTALLHTHAQGPVLLPASSDAPIDPRWAQRRQSRMFAPLPAWRAGGDGGAARVAGDVRAAADMSLTELMSCGALPPLP